ncbi:MAG: hypothetical protein OXS47_08205 [Chloroflexota bacterium]|nr:hypothetical protein [Chloroflexota bacterium]
MTNGLESTALVNPFTVTQAVDFSDDEITANWVDWPQRGGFASWLNVKSQMPRIVIGGKGTGRTHLMRHFSAPIQAIRGREDPLRQVREDGILGIYVRCSGLNSNRFKGRGQLPDTWHSVFEQYVDVWLAQAAVGAFAAITVAAPQRPSEEMERQIAGDVMGLLDLPREQMRPSSLADLQDHLFAIQQDIDRAVNNAALNPDKPLGLRILSNPGSLVFGVPAILRRHYASLKGVIFVYLIDELENFEDWQQTYIQSLLRERELGTSFMIGVRTYGLRTQATLTPSEDNKRGSEFDEIRQDRKYTGRDNRKKYEEFCQRVVARRLAEHDLMDDNVSSSVQAALDAFFEVPDSAYVEQLIINRFEPDQRPYLLRLREQLGTYGTSATGAPLKIQDVDSIVDAVAVPSRPLVEKANVLLLYQAWARGRDVVEAAAELSNRPADASAERSVNRAYRRVMDHYVTDLQAQLYRDLRMPPVYAGMREFITMSDGLPRNLLVILKNIYQWAAFNGEDPFRSGRISLDAQRDGVLESSNWFFHDAKPMGTDGEDVQAAIQRLGDMFRFLRFSSKPVESSLASFSADLTSCSPRSKYLVDLAEKWALLVEVERGQKERNTGLGERKFHLNRLLSPRWDLPTARRGAIRLSSEELNAIFDPDMSADFNRVLRRRLDRMNPPFGRRPPSRDPGQHTLDIPD